MAQTRDPFFINPLRIHLGDLFAQRQQAAKECEKFPVEERAYQVQLLVDAGLCEALVVKGEKGEISGAIVSRLTWAGHDFLDAMRDETIWKKAKEHVLRPGASWTFEVLKLWVKYQLLTKLGVPTE